MQDNLNNKNNFFENEVENSFDEAYVENENQQSFFSADYVIDDENSYRYKKGEVYPVVISSFKQNIKRDKKRKQPKTWLVATISAILGALVFSCVSPIIEGFVKNGEISQFSFGTVESEKNNVTPVTYNKDDRKVLSTVDIGKVVGLVRKF